ncbi:MAG TPA: hypothetical protein VFM96_07915 [Gaiellaceae bacterium]|nr:hypothetical protein [Gaiellaceae bacterium]
MGEPIPGWVVERSRVERWPTETVERREQQLRTLNVARVNLTDMLDGSHCVDLDSDAWTEIDESHATPLDDAIGRAITTLATKEMRRASDAKKRNRQHGD